MFVFQQYARQVIGPYGLEVVLIGRYIAVELADIKTGTGKILVQLLA